MNKDAAIFAFYVAAANLYDLGAGKGIIVLLAVGMGRR